MKLRLISLLVVLALAIPLGLSFNSGLAQDDGQQYGEAPMLAEQVAAGELPPVEERLPENPRVLDLAWSEPGVYGAKSASRSAAIAHSGADRWYSGQLGVV